jgi:cysteinyl-tRNA synthetase
MFRSLLLLIVIGGCSNKNDKNPANPAAKMQQFVIDISKYARDLKPGFIVIPQNGCELAFEKADASGNFNEDYLDAIDAIAVEELFYDSVAKPDEFRIGMLRKIKKEKPVMVADFVSDDANIGDAASRNEKAGFIPFPRASDNYDYSRIPEKVTNRNAADITNLEEAQNYLYLLNNAKFDDKKQLIDALKKTSFDVLVIDLYFGNTPFNKAEIAQLKTKANGGKRLVICYMNIGAAENWRYYWERDWEIGNPSWIKKHYENYDNEFWVQYWHKDWQHIIFGHEYSYTKKIIDAGFDGAFLDNAEAYYFLYKDK